MRSGYHLVSLSLEGVILLVLLVVLFYVLIHSVVQYHESFALTLIFMHALSPTKSLSLMMMSLTKMGPSLYGHPSRIHNFGYLVISTFPCNVLLLPLPLQQQGIQKWGLPTRVWTIVTASIDFCTLYSFSFLIATSSVAPPINQ